MSNKKNSNLPLNELSIDDVFNSNQNITYEIPIYQRNYAWEKEEIANLVSDVWDACEKKNETYFIGTLVTYDKGENSFEVIDGQQRLTTLFLILKALKLEVKSKLTYRARKRSNETLKNIPNFNPDNLDNGIKRGYENAKQAIGEVANGKEEQFADYLLSHVHLIHYNVPKDVDLNHYFEVMNSRGEQLEKHEIVKAKLMNVLNDGDKSKFAAIWESCSEMNTYIQTKTAVKAYFENNLKDFKYYAGTFDNLPSVNESSLKSSSLKSLIGSVEHQTDKNPIIDDDSKNSMFQPIIDFPNFLLIVLKITRMGDSGFIPNNFMLDDKELINEFDEAMKNGDGETFAKQFCFNLLKAKYLLDNYVVHHSKEEESYEHNPWQLRYWSKEEKGSTKNLYGNNIEQDKMVQLLSMFEVSFTARQRKNYLFYVLSHLLEDRNLQNYSRFLEHLAKKYFCDIYMVRGCLNEINTPRPGSFDQAIINNGSIDLHTFNSDITSDNFNTIYGDGREKTKGIPLFLFNYMDYRLWEKYAITLAGKELKKDDKERMDFFAELGCSDFELNAFKQFYFSRTRRSLEHFYPQANINVGINENQINCFGNFAMIGSEANSSGSNWTPHTKLDHYLDSSNKVRQASVASLKFRIMMQVCYDNYGKRNKDEEWKFDDIQKHQSLMLKILLKQRAI